MKKRFPHLVPKDLAFGVVVEGAIALEPAFNELPELSSEGIMVEEMINTQSRSRSFPRVSWTDAPLCGANAEWNKDERMS